MKEMIKMVVVLTILASFSGGILAAVRNGTKDRIEYQQLVFTKAPAIEAILEGKSNDPMTDRFKVEVGDKELPVFVGAFDGNRNTVVIENFGKGYGGDIGVMVGINTEDDSIVGIGVTTHAETPGLGSKAKDDPAFSDLFKGLSLKEAVKVKDDGGDIDSLSGATITSRGVCFAVTKAGEEYLAVKDKIMEKLAEGPPAAPAAQ